MSKNCKKNYHFYNVTFKQKQAMKLNIKIVETLISLHLIPNQILDT